MVRLLQEYVTRQAVAQPDRVAIVDGDTRLTYGELERRSNQLARLLKTLGCDRGDRVAVLMPKSPTAIVSLLAIYKADAVYVPLDPASPTPRLGKILESCDSAWLLAAGVDRSLLQLPLAGETPERQATRVAWLGAGPLDFPETEVAFTWRDVERCSPAPLSCRNETDDAAHILFTSGSTGTPKGVVITHANVIRFVEWATRYFEMDGADRVSAHPPLHFDLSFFDIFGTFAVGAELHLIPPELTLMPNKLADLIRSAGLTQWFSVPSVLTYMARLDAVRQDDFPAMKRLLWCGEVLPTPTLIHWMRRLPHVRFTNLYGPTEAMIASSYYTVPACPDDPGAALPIGEPCEGEELLVLDDARCPVPNGTVGDLYIGGVGLSPGYWRDPERTSAAFLPHPSCPSARIYKTGDLATVGADGLVYFLGRADSQIKSRGYRIELGEIEHALNGIPGIAESAVVAINTDGFEGSAICCAYVPAAGVQTTPAALRRALGAQLPNYMLPARWMALEQFPKNANGKIDRPRLRDAFATRHAQAS
jgi:amino acid adenylation domain-containing protein